MYTWSDYPLVIFIFIDGKNDPLLKQLIFLLFFSFLPFFCDHYYYYYKYIIARHILVAPTMINHRHHCYHNSYPHHSLFSAELVVPDVLAEKVLPSTSSRRMSCGFCAILNSTTRPKLMKCLWIVCVFFFILALMTILFILLVADLI